MFIRNMLQARRRPCPSLRGWPPPLGQIIIIIMIIIIIIILIVQMLLLLLLIIIIIIVILVLIITTLIIIIIMIIMIIIIYVHRFGTGLRSSGESKGGLRPFSYLGFRKVVPRGVTCKS